MGNSKSKKKKETGGLQPKGGAYALQDARVAADGLNTDMLGEGLISKEEEKAAKRAAKEASKAESLKAKEKSEKKGEKRPNIFKRMWKGGREMGGELRKVRWPGIGKTLKQTGVVLSVVLIFGIVVFGIDRGLGALYDLLMQAVTKS